MRRTISHHDTYIRHWNKVDCERNSSRGRKGKTSVRSSQYVAVNIANGRTRQWHGVFTISRRSCLRSSAIAVCSDGRLVASSSRVAQSDSLGLHGRLRRNQGAATPCTLQVPSTFKQSLSDRQTD